MKEEFQIEMGAHVIALQLMVRQILIHLGSNGSLGVEGLKNWEQLAATTLQEESNHYPDNAEVKQLLLQAVRSAHVNYREAIEGLEQALKDGK